MSFPISEHPSWEIKDSSKLTDFLTCPRKYFYTYLLGWKLDQPAHDLYFGESWHKAREYQLLHGYDDIEGAYNAFIQHYRKEFDQSTDTIYTPKDPAAVLKALMQYAEERRQDLVDYEVIYTEISGTVPVDEHRVLSYRMDSILRQREDDMIISMDHKSTKSFSKTWADQFDLNMQTGTYTHCLYCLYPVDKVLGVLYDGCSFEFLKRGSSARPAGYHINFKQVPAYKTPDQMNTWLWTVNDLLDRIDTEMNKLSYCSDSDEVLQSFPMNPESCTKYWGCAFHDYCLAWQNPLRSCEKPPIGFKIEYWDPSKVETTNKENLTWSKKM